MIHEIHALDQEMEIELTERIMPLILIILITQHELVFDLVDILETKFR